MTKTPITTADVANELEKAIQHIYGACGRLMANYGDRGSDLIRDRLNRIADQIAEEINDLP